MVYPTSQFLFLVEKKATWVPGGCFVHLQDNPRVWESGVLGSRGHAPSSAASSVSSPVSSPLAFSFVHSGTLVCGMEWLPFLSLACSGNLSGNRLTERGVSISWVAGTVTRHCGTVRRGGL